MLKLLFYRHGLGVLLANLFSLVLMILWLFKAVQGRVQVGAFSLFLIFSYLFFNFLRFYPWYGPIKEEVGLRFHFQQSLVPVVYISLVAFGLKNLGCGEAWMVAFSLLFLPLHYVALVLIYFHNKDKSPLRVGYFSQNHYLQDQ